MSMNNFADTVSYALKQPQVNEDIKSTLKSIHRISVCYHEEDKNMKQFFKKVQPKIEYLFWLFQNVENKYTEEQLSEIFEQFDDMKQKYIISKNQRHSFEPIDEPSISNYDTECLL